jgi:hypothetical protein
MASDLTRHPLFLQALAASGMPANLAIPAETMEAAGVPMRTGQVGLLERLAMLGRFGGLGLPFRGGLQVETNPMLMGSRMGQHIQIAPEGHRGALNLLMGFDPQRQGAFVHGMSRAGQQFTPGQMREVGELLRAMTRWLGVQRIGAQPVNMGVAPFARRFGFNVEPFGSQTVIMRPRQ